MSTGWADSVGLGWAWPLDPRTKACWSPRSNQNDSLAWGVLELHHFAQDGCWWEGIWHSLSATTFSRPGMCRALRITCFLVHQVKILHSRAQSGPCLLPCLCMTPLWCCWLPQEQSCLNRGPEIHLRLEILL